MKKGAKLIVIFVFSLDVLFILLSNSNFAGTGSSGFSRASLSPTPSVPQVTPNATISPTVQPSQTTMPSNPTPIVSANANKTSNLPTSSAEKKIKTGFTLDDQKEFALDDEKVGEGIVEFDHGMHSSKKYSVDGKSVIRCVECHHTNNQNLTSEVWSKENTEVKNCHKCHNPNSTSLNNEDAYHNNCYGCHDKVFNRVKETNPKFGTSDNCKGCHVKKS